jgi:hypothetical protein
MLQQCIEQAKKYKNTVIAGTLSLLLIVTASIATLYWHQQPEEMIQQEPITKEEPKKPSATEITPIKNDTISQDAMTTYKNTFNIGDIAKASVMVHEGFIEYDGTIINMYPETGTVLAQIKSHIAEFNYHHVVDIAATSITGAYDEAPVTSSVDTTIRAVLKTDGQLIFLRELNETNVDRYKIIDLVTDTNEIVYHYISPETCPSLPQYILNYLAEVKAKDEAQKGKSYWPC